MLATQEAEAGKSKVQGLLELQSKKKKKRLNFGTEKKRALSRKKVKIKAQDRLGRRPLVQCGSMLSTTHTKLLQLSSHTVPTHCANGESFYQFKIYDGGLEDGSVGKGAWHQTWRK